MTKKRDTFCIALRIVPHAWHAVKALEMLSIPMFIIIIVTGDGSISNFLLFPSRS